MGALWRARPAIYNALKRRIKQIKELRAPTRSTARTASRERERARERARESCVWERASERVRARELSVYVCLCARRWFVTAIQLIMQCEARDTMKGNFWDIFLCLFRMSQCESGGG
jgi:hypothetical protein